MGSRRASVEGGGHVVSATATVDGGAPTASTRAKTSNPAVGPHYVTEQPAKQPDVGRQREVVGPDGRLDAVTDGGAGVSPRWRDGPAP